MKSIYYWILFLISLTLWLLFTLHAAPLRNGVDVFVFREAGWNLATHGVFEAAGLINMRDIAPHLFAHYTPIFPLLFAGFLKIFPANDHAGAIFNLLLGSAASVALLFFSLRENAARLTLVTGLIIAVLPPIAMTYDRPEELGVVLASFTLLAVSANRFRPLIVGLLAAITFLGHPYYALVVIGWGLAILALRTQPLPDACAAHSSITKINVLIAASTFSTIIAIVALYYHHLDPTSLSRFAEHALGPGSGLGQVTNPERQYSIIENLRRGIFAKGWPHLILYLSTVILHLLLVAVLVWRRGIVTRTDQWLGAIALLSLLVSMTLFPAQGNYIIALSFITPIAILSTNIASIPMRRLALAFLCCALVAHIPLLAISTVQQEVILPSYRAALAQPKFLLNRISSPDAIVSVEYGSYDLYKPYFNHVIELGHTQLVKDFSKLQGVAVCYSGFKGEPNDRIDFPPGPDPRDFTLVQPAPMHQWVTLFGHRLMSRQWGFGCDIYLRNQKPQASTRPTQNFVR